MTTFLQLVVIGLSTGSAFALVGMSLVLVYRTTGIVNFAQGVFAVMGGLFTFQLSDDMPLALAALVPASGSRSYASSSAQRSLRKPCCCSSSATSRAAIPASPIAPGTSVESSSSRSMC